VPKFRSIFTKVTQSFDFNDMPDDFTRLLWLLLPLGLDCEGRGIYNFSWIKSKIFPIREDISEKKLQKAMEWLINRKNSETKLGMVEIYSVGDRQFFWVPTFKMYQRGFEKESPSVMPSPFNNTNSVPTQELVESESVLNTQSQSNAQTDSQADSQTQVPPVPFSFKGNDDVSFAQQVYTMVTTQPMIPYKFNAPAVETISRLRLTYKTEKEMIDYLKPFFEAWKNRRSQNGSFYNVMNATWLVDWAVGGVIPEPGGERVQKTKAEVILEKNKSVIAEIMEDIRNGN